MKVPSITEAKALMQEAGKRNPGPWIAHSEISARCAAQIASRCEGLDVDAAYSMGLLHDIGRYFGVTDCRHVIDGYRLMTEMGYEDVARICLTHSFPYQSIQGYGGGSFDISDSDFQFLKEYLEQTEYDDYDKLIQLADCMALASGVTYIEKRLVDVALRQGLGDCPLEKWRAFLELKAYFDSLAGINVYSLFDILTS